ncbi:MAG: glycosyl hydrolase family 65 protein, partial [Acidimicrobiia bacterium]
ITAQDSTFLSKERWDLEGTPPENYPLLLHYHPLVIYRYQVLKQPDVVMAMLLLPDVFEDDLRRANYDYYDPLTTGDSSLSSAVQATVAARIGYENQALEHLQTTGFIDLSDSQGNTRDGLHLASAGGVWMALVRGFGGMRVSEGELELNPSVPVAWESLRFRIQFRESRVVVTARADEVEVRVEGQPLTLRIWGKSVSVGSEAAVSVPRIDV